MIKVFPFKADVMYEDDVVRHPSTDHDCLIRVAGSLFAFTLLRVYLHKFVLMIKPTWQHLH
jgi:hypothetical protein